MNDALTPEPTQSSPAEFAATDAAGPAAGPATAGQMIRAAREAQGLALASLAAMLKVPLRRLEALEGDRHGELQGPTFERALAQTACRALKIDPKPVLALLPQHENNTLEHVSEGINTPFRDGQGSRGFELPALLRPGGIVVILLILAAIALFVVPEGWLARVTHSLVGESAAASAPADADAASAAEGVTSAPVQLQDASASAPAVPEPASAAASAPVAAVASAPVAAVVPTPAPTASVAAANPGAAPARAVPTPGGGPLQVIASADSWVSVVDADGRTLLSRTVAAGETVDLDGALPLHVKVGNAGGTRLKLRGDNVDLTPWTRDNVAHLELK